MPLVYDDIYEITRDSSTYGIPGAKKQVEKGASRA